MALVERVSREACAEACKLADLPWLINLLLGLATAFVLASFAIPRLMEKYPSVMWGLFFGLVLGSVITPWRQVARWHVSRVAIIAVFALVCYYLMGQHVQAPVAVEYVVADGTKALSALCEEAPCFYTPSDVYAMGANAGLRGAVSGAAQFGQGHAAARGGAGYKTVRQMRAAGQAVGGQGQHHGR